MVPIFTARINDKDVTVQKFAREGLYFGTPVGKVGSMLSLVFLANAEGIALELPVSGEIKSTLSGQLVVVQFSEVQKSALKTLFDVKQARPFEAVKVLYSSPPENAKAAAFRQIPQLATMAVVCFALLVTIADLLNRRGSVIEAPAAFVASSGSDLESKVSGKLEYLVKGDQIRVGEIFAAIRTISGRAVYLEAGKSGTLIGAGLNLGKQVNKGDKIFQLTNPDDRYFVAAYINYADVVALTRGYNAEVTFGDKSATRIVMLQSVQISDIVPYQQFYDEAGNALVQVRLPLADKDPLISVGKAVSVRFVKADSSFAKFVPSLLGTLSDTFSLKTGG